MRVAIIHDWLVTYAGAERVLEQMLAVYPEADLYSMVEFVPEKERAFLGGRQVRTSYVQNLPMARTKYRHYISAMTLAVEQFDLSAYDLVLSSSYAVAKGVLTGPDQLHICLCHSPMRYCWDMQHQYLRETGLDSGLKGMAARKLLHKLRIWDQRTANGVGRFIAVSDFIARRIWKVYRRRSTVIHPPVDTEGFAFQPDKDDFYLAASRMVPYKRLDLIAEAFAQLPDRRLIIIGDGPEMARVRAKAGPNVSLMGYQPFSVLRDHMQRARAFVFAAEEDFGIVPIEAQACGTPVIAYGKGGALETIVDGETGHFFNEHSPGALAQAVREFEAMAGSLDPRRIRAHSERFSAARFRQEYSDFVNSSYEEFRRSGYLDDLRS